MGLQSQLSDVSSESTIILMAMLIGKIVRYLRSHILGSGLPCHQSTPDRVYSYCRGVDHFDSDCVVCLNPFADGDNVCKLACRHVFHNGCFDGWLEQVNFICPVCRTPLVPDERVATDLPGWFHSK